MCNNSSDLTVQKWLQAYIFAISFVRDVYSQDVGTVCHSMNYSAGMATILLIISTFIHSQPSYPYLNPHSLFIFVNMIGRQSATGANWFMFLKIRCFWHWFKAFFCDMHTDWEAFPYSDQSVLQTALNLVCRIIEALFLFILCPCRSCINLFQDGIWQLFDEILKQM